MISNDLIEADKNGIDVWFSIEADGIFAFVNGAKWNVKKKDLELFKAHKLKPFEDTIDQISKSNIGVATCAYLMKLVKKDERLYWNEYLV